MSENTLPLLSLCIPTYRRAALLTEVLESVLSQLPPGEAPNPWVEIVISDNDSADATADAVRQVQMSRPDVSIRYFCQDGNRGADANIYSALGMGCGEFLLALSDDDVLLPSALAALLDALGKNASGGAVAPDVLGLNSASFVTDSASLRIFSMPLQADRTFGGAGECLRLFGSGITFLSAFAVRRSLLAGRDYTLFVGCNILQSYMFLDALAAAQVIRVLARPVIGIRENNSGGYNYFEVFVTNFLAALDYAVRVGVARADVSAIRISHLHQQVFPFVLAARVKDTPKALDFQDGARRILKAYGPRPFVMGVLLPLLLLPKGFLHAVRRIYLWLRPIKRQADAGSLGTGAA